MFTEYLAWQSAKTLRETGALPSPATQRTRGERLKTAAKLGGYDTCVSLVTGLQDRKAVCSLVDALSAAHSPGTLRGDLGTLRQLAAWGIAKGYITSCAIEKTDGPRTVPQKRITTYSATEVEALVSIARARDLRFWCFLVTIEQTGCRVSEVLGARWEDLRLDEATPYLELPTTKTTQRLVPLTSKLREEVFITPVMTRLKEKGNPRFTRDIAVYPFPWTYQTACGILRTCCDRVPCKYTGFHIFRHTYATRMLARKGVSIQAVAHLLGHSDVSTTSRLYDHTTSLSYSHLID